MTAILFLVFSLAFFLDLFLRTHGIASAFTPCCIFYYSAALGWKTGLPLALTAAIPAAVFSGSAWPFELIAYPAAAGLSLWNLNKSAIGGTTLRRHLLCGALIPVLTFGPGALTGSHEAILVFLAQLLPLCALYAVLLPLILLLLDILAEKLALPRYADAWRQWKRRMPG